MASLLVGVHYTGALFTDTQAVGANSFVSGSVDISTSPASALFSLSGMAPGDVTTAPLTVTNGGSLQLRYAIRSTSTEAVLSAAMTLAIKSGVSSCTNGGFGSSGTSLYSGILGNTTGLNVVGDPAAGSQTGDRTLNAGANETLCLQVTLPISAGNTLQGISNTTSLDFVAEQVANNP